MITEHGNGKKINNKNVAAKTLAALDLFKEGLYSATLIHIPHSSSYIPSFESMNKERAIKEVDLLTDWATDRIFDIENCEQLVVPFSRVFCDVERLPDEQEPMFKKGRGFYYTHSDDGQRLRSDNPGLKQKILTEYYQPHHDRLLKECQKRLDKFGFCQIIDAHSFSEYPLQSEENQEMKRPDICLGTDEFHTPLSMINSLKSFFEYNGLTVEINRPYSGTIVPLPLYKKEIRLSSIMIEVNKRCYMKDNRVLPQKVLFLNELMNEI